MAISVFDLFKVGIGPCSSHTVGPMRAAAFFVKQLQENGQMYDTCRVVVRLWGSLSATGVGHGSDRATITGLTGKWPDEVDPLEAQHEIQQMLKPVPYCWQGVTPSVLTGLRICNCGMSFYLITLML